MDLRQYLPGGSPALPLESSAIKTLTLSKSASPRTRAHCDTRVTRDVANESQLGSLRSIGARYYPYSRSIINHNRVLPAFGSLRESRLVGVAKE